MKWPKNKSVYDVQLIKVWLSVVTLWLFCDHRSNPPDCAIVITPVFFLPCSQRNRSKVFRSRLIFSQRSRRPRRDHDKWFFITTTKVFFCDHSMITAWSQRDHGSKVFTRVHAFGSRQWSRCDHGYIFIGVRLKLNTLNGFLKMISIYTFVIC